MKKMTRKKVRLFSATSLVLIATWLAGEASPASLREEASARLWSDPSNTPTVTVSFRDGLLSVEAKAGTWRQVLNEIEKQTEIRFHYSSPLAGLVTVSLTALPVKQALERLFGPEAGLVIRYDRMAYASASLPQEVWVLGNMGDAEAIQTITGGRAGGQRSAHANNAVADSNQTSTDRDRTDKLAAAAETATDEGLIDHFVAMSRDEDPHMRRQAIAALSNNRTGGEDSAVASALDAALTDEDASVRAYAVQALAKRGGAQAMTYLWEAMQDPDTEVRLMAVESTELEDEGRVLLDAALSDVNEIVRSTALYRLEKASNQVDAE